MRIYSFFPPEFYWSNRMRSLGGDEAYKHVIKKERDEIAHQQRGGDC